MKLSITYQELQQLIADKLHQNVELQATNNVTLKISMHKEIMSKNVDSSVEMALSMFGSDLYADYRVVPVDNIKNKLLSGLIDHFTPDFVEFVINYFQSKYPQYNDIVEKVPNANRLRIHLAAIPQLQTVLQHVEIDSITPQEDGLQIVTHLKNK